MYDVETESLWSHLLGKAMAGPLEGTELQTLPGVMTEWSHWRKLHPATTAALLSRTTEAYHRDFYRSPSHFVIGLQRGTHSRAWPLDQLARTPVVNDTLHDLPLVVVYDARTFTARIFSRRTQAGTVTLETDRQGNLVDVQTGAVWYTDTGRAATKSTEALGDLVPLPGILSDRTAWLRFHPDTTLYVARARNTRR